MVVVCRYLLGVYNLQPDPWRFWLIFFVFFTLRNVIDLGFIHPYVFFGLENVASVVELLFNGFVAQSYDLVYKCLDLLVLIKIQSLESSTKRLRTRRILRIQLFLRQRLKKPKQAFQILFDCQFLRVFLFTEKLLYDRLTQRVSVDFDILLHPLMLFECHGQYRAFVSPC